jgi:hypothetical protein
VPGRDEREEEEPAPAEEQDDLVVAAVPTPRAEPVAVEEEQLVAVAHRAEEVEERTEPDRPDAAALLVEQDERWTDETRSGQDGDHVPVVRPDESADDTSGWDADADWLQDDGPADA